MVNKKRGLSDIISTIIIVGITLIGVGIVMYVVMPLFQDSAEGVSYSNKCLNAGVTITKVEGTGPYTVFLKRTAGMGDEEFDGVRVVLRDEDGGNLGSGDYEDNIGQLDVVFVPDVTASGTVTKVDAIVFFTKEDGTEYLCTGQIASKDI